MKSHPWEKLKKTLSKDELKLLEGGLEHEREYVKKVLEIKEFEQLEIT